MLRDVSRTQLAEYLHLSESAVGKIERGESCIDYERLKSIGKFLNCPLNFFDEDNLFYDENNGNNSLLTTHNSNLTIVNDKLIEVLQKIADQLSVLIEKIK